MEFVKVDMPINYEISVVHCKDCDCDIDDTQEAYLRNKAAKATGG